MGASAIVRKLPGVSRLVGANPAAHAKVHWRYELITGRRESLRRRADRRSGREASPAYQRRSKV